MGSPSTWYSREIGVGVAGDVYSGDEYSGDDVDVEYDELKDIIEPLRDEILDAPDDSAGVMQFMKPHADSP